MNLSAGFALSYLPSSLVSSPTTKRLMGEAKKVSCCFDTVSPAKCLVVSTPNPKVLSKQQKELCTPPLGGLGGVMASVNSHSESPCQSNNKSPVLFSTGLGENFVCHNEASTALFSLISAMASSPLAINTALLYDHRLRLFGSLGIFLFF